MGRPGWALFLLTGISVAGFIDRIVMQVLVEPVKREFALTDLQIGLVTGLAFALLNVVLGLAVARQAERRPRLPFVWIGTLLWSAATALCGAAGSFGALLAARVGVGVGEAVGLPAATSIVSDLYPRARRATAVSALNLAPPIGAFLGSAGGAMMAQAYGWRSAFLLAAVPGLLFAGLLAATVTEPVRGRHDALEPGSTEAVPPLAAVLRRFAVRRSLTHLLAGSAIVSMAGFAVNAFLAAFLLRRFGFSVGEAGVIAGLIASVPATVSVIGGGWLCDRLGARDPRAYALVPGMAALATAPLYALAVTRDGAAAAIALLGVTALVQYVYIGVTAGTIQNQMHPRMRASAYAITGLIYSLIGGAVGPMLLGWLSDTLAPAGRADAGAVGLEYALVAMTAFYLWGGVHYLLASRHLPGDLARPVDEG